MQVSWFNLVNFFLLNLELLFIYPRSLSFSFVFFFLYVHDHNISACNYLSNTVLQNHQPCFHADAINFHHVKRFDSLIWQNWRFSNFSRFSGLFSSLHAGRFKGQTKPDIAPVHSWIGRSGAVLITWSC
jgi:hypothetical protein